MPVSAENHYFTTDFLLTSTIATVLQRSTFANRTNTSAQVRQIRIASEKGRKEFLFRPLISSSSKDDEIYFLPFDLTWPAASVARPH